MSFISSESSDCTCYPAERNGYEYNSFIAHVFSECVYEPRQVIGVWVGMSSLVFWVMAQVPQFIKNKERKSANSLSPWFLLEWMLGDVLNLIGCVMTHQLITQLATGILFIIVDSTMISQMTYYTLIYPRRKRRKLALARAGAGGGGTGQGPGPRGFTERDPLLANRAGGESSDAQDMLDRVTALDTSDIDSDNSAENGETGDVNSNRSRGVQGGGNTRAAVAALSTLPIVVVMCAGVQMFGNNAASSSSNMMSMSSSDMGRRMLLGLAGGSGSANVTVLGMRPSCEVPVVLPESVESAGLTLGWISAFIYLNSRLPQMLKNYRRKSVEGLSWIMFFCALMGNSTYGIGVIMHDSSPKALWAAAPWLLGSLGTLSLDMFISFQFFLYAEASTTPVVSHHERTITSDGYESLDDATDADGATIEQSPARGLYGIKSWTTSPFWRPRRASSVQREVASGSIGGNGLLNDIREDDAQTDGGLGNV